jgi:ABC-2 type transport system ATP-binding protein
MPFLLVASLGPEGVITGERMTTVLGFEGIEKRYGDTVALRGVTFDVRAGEVFGLLGPNGAGKTSLMRILLDILRADAGTITVFGEPRKPEHLDRFAFLPEERGLYTKQPVLRVMTYFGTLKGLSSAEAKKRARAWLERIGLPEVASFRVERLSKGMSQKVQIAATLLAEPEICVLDEPSTGLDPVNVRLVEDLIRERRMAGKTTILSTHQMNTVESLCDRVALIHRGKLMVYGDVAEVRERYSLPEVRVGHEGEPPAVPEVTSASRDADGTWRLRLRDGTAPHEALRALIAAGARVHSFEKILAPMEEIFVRVVREAAE